MTRPWRIFGPAWNDPAARQPDSPLVLTLANPNGIVPFSPGLRGTSCSRRERVYLLFCFPWVNGAKRHNPKGVVANHENKPMPQSLSIVYIHLVFSTKDRRPFFRDRTTRESLHAYLGGISKQLDCPPVLAGGVEDHVHWLRGLAARLRRRNGSRN